VLCVEYVLCLLSEWNCCRVGQYAHPLSFVNDGDTNSIWISSQSDEIYITVDLGDSFQVNPNMHTVVFDVL